MSLPILLLVATTAQPFGHASTKELTQAFDAMCLRDNASLEGLLAKISATGFRSVAVVPSQLENREVAAWRRGGVRLAATAGSPNSTWKLRPMCLVTAEVGRISNDNQVLKVVSRPLRVLIVNGQPSSRGSMYHLMSEKGIIDLALDKQDYSHVVMSLLWQVGQPSPTLTHLRVP